jgi:hypothetical protein
LPLAPWLLLGDDAACDETPLLRWWTPDDMNHGTLDTDLLDHWCLADTSGWIPGGAYAYMIIGMARAHQLTSNWHKGKLRIPSHACTQYMQSRFKLKSILKM